MSLSEKLQSAHALIEEYNHDSPPEDQINIPEFDRKLRKLGGASERLLAAAKWEDFVNCGLPTILARSVAEVFRAPPKRDEDFVPEHVAAKMHPLALLEKYDYRKSYDFVAKRLNEISGGRRFVVFDDTGRVIVQDSYHQLEQLQKGLPETEVTMAEGKARQVYRVGDRPPIDSLADEDPIFAGRPLRGQMSDQLNRSWEGVPLHIRQLVYLAVNRTGELGKNQAHDIYELAKREDAEMMIRARAAAASILFDKLQLTDELPRLKVDLSGASRRNNPFAVGRNRTF